MIRDREGQHLVVTSPVFGLERPGADGSHDILVLTQRVERLLVRHAERLDEVTAVQVSPQRVESTRFDVHDRGVGVRDLPPDFVAGGELLAGVARRAFLE